MRKETESQNLLADLGYETTDVDVKKVITGITVLFVFIGATSIFTFGLYKFFEPEYLTVRSKPAFAQARRLPPMPQVQVHPKPELTFYHEATDAELGESIDKAKESAAARGISGVREGAKP